jgi:hypothetical protein
MIILGGAFVGNGIVLLNIGFKSLVSGCSFTDINITSTQTTFTNCNFNGQCNNLGNKCNFINCNFNNITSVSIPLGTIQQSTIFNSQITNVSNISCSTISGESRIGSTSGSIPLLITGSYLANSRVDAINSDFTFTNNKTDESKIFVGNSTTAPPAIRICLNQFERVKPGFAEVIEILPNATTSKFYSVQSNTFRLRSTDLSAIRIVGTDGSGLGYSFCSVMDNSFWLGQSTLVYGGNMKVFYSGNAINSSGGSLIHPSATGNLQVSNNPTF